MSSLFARKMFFLCKIICSLPFVNENYYASLKFVSMQITVNELGCTNANRSKYDFNFNRITKDDLLLCSNHNT
jgi:hypothetical protein